MLVSLKKFGINKATLRRKYHSTDRRDTTMDELLSRRTTNYTLAEVEYMAGYLITGHDLCVLDNPVDYSAVEAWTARRNEETFDRVMAFIKEMRPRIEDWERREKAGF